MAPIENRTDAMKGGALGAVGGAAAAASGGLDRAAQAAGDVLRGIFGGLPWEMAGEAIANAVSGGGGAGLIDVVGVML